MTATSTILEMLDSYSGEIFIDASFWIAMMNPRDEHYNQARVIWESIIRGEMRPLTTNWTLHEAATHLNSRGMARHDLALNLLDLVHGTAIVENASDFEELTLEVFKSHSGRRWSVVDCANFVCIRERQSRFALSYDVRDFSQAQTEFGFTLLGYVHS